MISRDYNSQSILGERDEYDLLFATCEIIGKRQKIKLIRPPSIAESGNFFEFIEKISEASGIRVRKVSLAGHWWKQDAGPLLGFYRGQPCALLPKKLGGYQLIDLNQNRCLRVSAAVAETISTFAFCFYSQLPQNIRKLSDFFNFSLSQVKDDFRLFVAVQLLMSIFILTVPVAMGFLFNRVIPNMDFRLLWQVIALLTVNTVVITLCRVVQIASQTHLRFKLNAITTPAIWDKILKLPIRFFRRFTGGDLTFRAGVITEIQNTLTQAYLMLIAGGLSSMMTLILLFYYSFPLAVIALTLMAIVIGVVLVIHFRQLKFMRMVYCHFRKFAGLVFELMAGISKIRVTNSMSTVFEIWGKRLSARSEAEKKIKLNILAMEVFISLMTVIHPLILYALAQHFDTRLTFGDFVAFTVAYSWLFITLLAMAADLGDLMRTIPLWKQSRIIFTAKIEREGGYADPGELTGDIVLKNIVFRYHAYEQPVFKDFSLSIRPGEFVAVVGPSGCGKSTLFRLMLGFEEPEAGEIYYNGLNLRTLNLSAVRRQIGVVIQTSTLIPGTIFANIAGNSLKMTRLEAWEIAEKVGLAEFIKQLPMQMDTLITEGAITLSGGEVQRLILARALAQKPKLLVLDEATSALDNTTQAVVHNYLKQLQATQIIAAHRLSTIINANRIVVMDQGAIVQIGTFTELISQPGLFAQMAKRQL